MINYHNRKFRAVSNSENGAVSAEMVFHYQQEGPILFCSYQGQNIQRGHLLGMVDDEGNINMNYHQINNAGQVLSGECFSRPEIMGNGKIRLHENWQWTCLDFSKGQSILEEL